MKTKTLLALGAILLTSIGCNNNANAAKPKGLDACEVISFSFFDCGIGQGPNDLRDMLAQCREWAKVKGHYIEHVAEWAKTATCNEIRASAVFDNG